MALVGDWLGLEQQRGLVELSVAAASDACPRHSTGVRAIGGWHTDRTARCRTCTRNRVRIADPLAAGDTARSNSATGAEQRRYGTAGGIPSTGSHPAGHATRKGS